ncbi:MAG: hypothetical protein N2491_01490 [Negativicutes bacterium]|nr:hypothetical protein [Negativicutes bacterium]
MSERLSLQDILREYGIPLVQLDVTATEEQCHRLREHLKSLTADKKQGYLEVKTTFYIDIHDIDRYLTGELPNLAAIYAFPEDVRIYEEE